MRKKWMLLLLPLLLTGCAVQPVYETLGDVWAEPVAVAEIRQVQLSLPEDAAQPVLQGEQGSQIFICQDYEVWLETMPAGDLNSTLCAVTGREREDLTVLETQQDGVTRYDCAWSAVDEEGERVAHTAVLDDGAYHYCLTALWPSDKSVPVEEAVDQLFAGFALV